MKTKCQVCESVFEVDEKYNGEVVDCPKCQSSFIVEKFEDKKALPEKSCDNKSKPNKTDKSQPANTESGVKFPKICRAFDILGWFFLALAIIYLTIPTIAGFCSGDSVPIAIGVCMFTVMFFLFLMMNAASIAIKLLAKIEFNTREKINFYYDFPPTISPFPQPLMVESLYPYFR